MKNYRTPSATGFAFCKQLSLLLKKNVLAFFFLLTGSSLSAQSPRGFLMIPGNDTSIILPLQMLSFKGTAQNCTSFLSWSNSEETFDHFDVQQSIDGLSFVTLGSVVATGSGNYKFKAEARGAGKQYYRLKMVNKNGEYSLSSIIILDGCDTRLIRFFPNPVSNMLLVNGLEAGEQVSIYTTYGQLIKQVCTTDSRLYVDMGRYATGLYQVVVRLANSDLLKIEKVQKL